MITPRRTRLHRVPNLHAFRRVLLELARVEPPASTLVIVPTRAAAVELGANPVFVTRDELYDRLHDRLASPLRRLGPIEREVIAQAAARAAKGEAVRQGLVAEILRFYDQLRRQGQSVDRFETLLEDALGGEAEFDLGADRLLVQSRVLAETFRRYEARCREIGAFDEHSLRSRLIEEPSRNPVMKIVVSVSDWIAEPNGLYPADFDLLSRISGLEAIDVVATQGVLASGFHERLHQWLPGLEEVDRDPVARTPKLLVPAADEAAAYVAHRDREEELWTVARLASIESKSTAVVYKHPLPYLYLGRTVFGGSGLAYGTSDGLPLAAEPFAAALDLVLDLMESGFTRGSIVSLLRSPHFQFEQDAVFSREAIDGLNRFLANVRYVGGLDRLTAFTEDLPALRTAQRIASHLAPLVDAAPASTHLRALHRFLTTFASRLTAEDGIDRRLGRGRAAVLASVQGLADAYARHDDRITTMAELIPQVRRWIEDQTFSPDTTTGSPDQGSIRPAIRLMDDQAARYADVDQMAIVGLIQGQWPERPTRNIFYPTSLIAALGWPSEKDRRAAAEARFLELLGSANELVLVSTIKLDDEALVEPSTLLQEIGRAGLATSVDRTVPASSSGHRPNTGWTALRDERRPTDSPQFHGQIEALAPTSWTVSALETYLACPFKFFARYILRLAEEFEDEEILDPRREGEFVHDVFECFFRRWNDTGHGAVTPENLDEARRLFAEVVELRLSAGTLSDAERDLQRTHLLGSPVAAGLGEAVLLMEAERPTPVVDRLLEHKLAGWFDFETTDGRRQVELRGKADRIDLLADGTFRLIDYKLGRAPNKARALQLPIYAICAEQRLDRYRGRQWTAGEAAYVAFKGPKQVVPLFGSPADRSAVFASAQQRLVETVDRIAGGHFPPTPDDVFRCETCAYTSVCRKDYVGDV